MKKTLSLLLALCFVFGVFAAGTAFAEEPAKDAEAEKPVVYFTDDISPEGLVAIYEALNWKPVGPVAVKLSTGEPPYSNYLRPELIADLVKQVDGTIVECNTAYGGQRAATAEHYQRTTAIPTLPTSRSWMSTALSRSPSRAARA